MIIEVNKRLLISLSLFLIYYKAKPRALHKAYKPVVTGPIHRPGLGNKKKNCTPGICTIYLDFF